MASTTIVIQFYNFSELIRINQHKQPNYSVFNATGIYEEKPTITIAPTIYYEQKLEISESGDCNNEKCLKEALNFKQNDWYTF